MAMSSAGSDLRRLLAKAKAPARDFLGWWLGELKALVPARVRRALVPSRTRILVETEGGDAVLSHLRNGRREPIGRIDLGEPEAPSGPPALPAMIGDGRPGASDVVLCLPRSDVLSWRFRVPPSAMAELDQALRYRIELETPFRAEEVLFDYRTEAGTADGRAVRVEAVVVPRARADRILAPLAARGLEPDIIDIAGIDDDQIPRFNLLPHDKAPAWSGLVSPVNLGLALGVLGLLVTLLVLPIEQRRSLSARLDARLAEVQQGADEALRLRAEVEQLATDGRFLADLKTRRPHRVVILDALSALLPDHTSLSGLEIRGGEVQIVGRSAAASSLIALLDGSPLFHDPKFRSSVTQDRRTGRERFVLSFLVEEAPAQDTVAGQ